MANQELKQELNECVTMINTLINELFKTAQQLGCSPFEVKSNDGALALAPLLVAKAEALHGLALLEVN